MDIFSALAEPTRRNIIEILASRGELSASEICDEFSVSPPAISQHLKVLRDTNLVQMEKRAQQRLYRINTDAIGQLETWARKMKQVWSERFDRLDEVLEVEKKKLSRKHSKSSRKIRKH
jgi:DNA-binding transcriptional ArsR family regulator